jgi:hypothetical protein
VRVLVENEVNCAYMLLVGDEETATDFIKYPRYWNYSIMRGLKAVDESRFRNQISLELEEETRKDYEALHPRFKDRRNGEWCVDAKLHERARKVDVKLAEFLKQPYIEFRWLVNSEWRFAGSHVHGNADALSEQVSRSEHVITIEQKYDSEYAAEALYAANFALSLVLHLIDSLLGAKNAPAVLARLKKFKYLPPERFHVLTDCRVRFSQRTAFEDDHELQPDYAIASFLLKAFSVTLTK